MGWVRKRWSEAGVRYREDPSHARFMFASALLGLSVVAGVVLAIIFTSQSDEARWFSTIGPLSEWVPGTLTAVTLIYTLHSVRRDRAERAVRDVREQASHVNVWISRVRVTMGMDGCQLWWCNTSVTPVYEMVIGLKLSDGQSRTIPIGVLPGDPDPRTEVLLEYDAPAGDAIDPERPFPIETSCTFRDGNNIYWLRDSAGRLHLMGEAPDRSRLL